MSLFVPYRHMDNVNAIETLAALAGVQGTGVQKNAAFDMAFITLRG